MLMVGRTVVMTGEQQSYLQVICDIMDCVFNFIV
jgi:hypothetical protein